MNILITGAGGASAISLWKSLKDRHNVYMGDMDACAAGLYLVPPENRLILPSGDAPAFAETLLELCQQKQVNVLLPTVDWELLPLSRMSARFAQKAINVPICTTEVLERCLDKHELLRQCAPLGVAPEFTLLSPDTILDTLHFPCFVKPRRGAGSRGAMRIDTPEALRHLPADNSMLVQTLLTGDEYSVDVYIHSSGTPLAAVPRLRMKIDSGIAVAAQTRILPELSRLAVAVAQITGIRYVANIQFRADDKGDFKLLEINPRFPGTLPLTTAAGIDIPKLLLDDLQGFPSGNTLLPFKDLMVVRYWTEVFFPIEEWESLCPG